MTNKTNNNQKLVKIVYFDEMAAADYLILKDEGITEQIICDLTQDDYNKKLNFDGKLWARLPLFGILGASIKGNGEINIENNQNNIIQTTISNSLLTDFIKKVEDIGDIDKLENYKLTTYPNSITHIKLYTPFLNMISNDFGELSNTPINFQSIDDAIENGKGYFELLAYNGEKSIILRFNISSFRNNYKLVDLTKMNLIYYAIKVGTAKKQDLHINNELNIQNSPSVDLEELEGFERNNYEEWTDDIILDVCDVILAGVN